MRVSEVTMTEKLVHYISESYPGGRVEISIYSTENEPTPPPPPEPDPTIIMRVKSMRPNKQTINCHFQKGTNNAGRPIMYIYPKPSAPVGDRVQIDYGKEFEVYRGIIKADGGGGFYSIAALPDGQVYPKGTQLYTPVEWVVKA